MTTHDMTAPRTQRSSRWLWIGIGALILAAVLFRGASFLFGGSPPDLSSPVSGVTTVAVDDNVFAPAAIEVPAGATVTWEWRGSADHNVVGDGFESAVQDEGEFGHTFTAPGTYDYRCTLHGGMGGRVMVTEETA